MREPGFKEAKPTPPTGLPISCQRRGVEIPHADQSSAWPTIRNLSLGLSSLAMNAAAKGVYQGQVLIELRVGPAQRGGELVVGEITGDGRGCAEGSYKP